MKEFRKKAREKKDRAFDRVDNFFHRSSRSNTPEPPALVSENAPRPKNDPPPSGTAPDFPSDLSPILVPPSLLAMSASTSAPRSTIGIPQTAEPEATSRGPSPSAFGDNAVPALIVSEPPISEATVAHSAWTGLKTLGGVLKGWGDTFGPLKSAVEAISGCVKIYEVRIQVRFVLSLCI
jgi:hypothetical protein